jgi:hypothetical protein
VIPRGAMGEETLQPDLRTFLLDACRPVTRGAQPPAAREDWTRLEEAAFEQGIETLLWQRILKLEAAALPAGVAEHAALLLERSRQSTQDLLDELCEIVPELEQAGVVPVVLKGPALAAIAWGDPLARPSSDLDLLVPEGDLETAGRVLQGLGYERMPRPYDLIREYHYYRASDDMTVDLHWNVVGAQFPLALDVGAVAASGRRLRLGTCEVLVPSPAWLLVLAAVYAVKDHPQTRLVRLVDIERLVDRVAGLDWQEADRIACGLGVRRILRAALLAAERVVGFERPPPRQWLDEDATARRSGAHLADVVTGMAAERRPRQLFWLTKLRLQAGLRERRRDRFATWASLGLLALLANAEDRRVAANLPVGLAPALIRPWRLMGAVLGAYGRRARAEAAGGWNRLLRVLSLRGWRRLRPASDTSLHLLEGEGLLVSITRQEIWELNNTAAFIWCCIEDGLDLGTTVAAYAQSYGRPFAEARAELQGLLEQWWRMGVLEGSQQRREQSSGRPPGLPAKESGKGEEARAPGPRRFYRLLDLPIEIGFPHDAAMARVAPVLAPFAVPAADRAPPVRLEILEEGEGEFLLLLDGGVVERCHGLDRLAPAIKAELLVHAVNRYGFALDLHAAVLRFEEACLLLPAAPGSGKTVLAATLAQNGFAYLSDEVAILDSSFEVRGIPLCLTVKPEGFEVLRPLYPELAFLPEHRRGDGRSVRYLPPPISPGDHALDRHWPVRWVVFPRYRQGVPTRLEPIGRVAALRRLLEECLALRLALDHEKVALLVAWLAGIECFSLSSADPDEAVSLLRRMCEGSLHKAAAEPSLRMPAS